MNIETVDFRGSKVIVISGDIDMYTAPELRNELMALIRKKHTPLLVDFGGVSYIDSSGIATFVEGLKVMMSYQGKLKLVNVPQGILEIFNFAKLDRVFSIYGNRDDALAG